MKRGPRVRNQEYTMSENILKLISASPDYVPRNVALQRACELLASFFPEANEANCEASEEVRFIDQGQNWERVLCPVCRAELDTTWWQQAMRAASQTGFTDLSVDLPCCGGVSSLNDLQYEWPAGFARFALEVHSPGRDLDDKQLKALEKALGCKLRKIWAHY
jgi:hypothetical protein